MLAARVVHQKTPRGVMKIDDEVLNDALIKHKQHFEGFDLQKRAYYNLRDEIHQYVKTCANNVRLIIYVDNVLDQPIKISAGKTENELRITIKIDGTLKVKWTKEICSYEANIEEVNENTLDYVFQRFMHRFIGIESQRQAFHKVRDMILDLDKTFADNVKVVIYVIDVFDKPIVISTRKTDNELRITIQIDGALKVKWTKEACLYEANIEEVNENTLDDVLQRFMHRFIGIEPQRQAFNKVRDMILDLVTTFADNVKVLIKVIDVFDKPIVISTRKTDNELRITIKIDGTLEVKWKTEPCSYEANITEVNVQALEDVFQRYRHRFVDNKPQRQAFYNIRDMIHDLVKFCANNVQIVINVEDVLKKPIIISTEKTENEVHFTVKPDGTVTKRWTKETWRKCLCDNRECMKVVLKDTTEIIRNIGLLLVEIRSVVSQMNMSSSESRG